MIKAFIFIILFALHAFAQESQPKVVNAVAPEKYPPAALAVRASGEVKVEVEIDKDGNVVSAKAISGHPLLRNASIEAALKWKFSLQDNDENNRFTAITFIFYFVSTSSKGIDGITNKTEYSFDKYFVEPNRMYLDIHETNYIPKIKLLERVDSKLEDKFCKLHKVKMKNEIVDIIYGLIYLEDAYLEAEKKYFPNANFESFGGCVVEPIEKEEVYYCDKCRIAKKNWVKKREIKLGLKEAAKK